MPVSSAVKFRKQAGLLCMFIRYLPHCCVNGVWSGCFERRAMFATGFDPLADSIVMGQA